MFRGYSFFKNLFITFSRVFISNTLRIGARLNVVAVFVLCIAGFYDRLKMKRLFLNGAPITYLLFFVVGLSLYHVVSVYVGVWVDPLSSGTPILLPVSNYHGLGHNFELVSESLNHSFLNGNLFHYFYNLMHYVDMNMSRASCYMHSDSLMLCLSPDCEVSDEMRWFLNVYCLSSSDLGFSSVSQSSSCLSSPLESMGHSTTQYAGRPIELLDNNGNHYRVNAPKNIESAFLYQCDTNNYCSSNMITSRKGGLLTRVSGSDYSDLYIALKVAFMAIIAYCALSGGYNFLCFLCPSVTHYSVIRKVGIFFGHSCEEYLPHPLKL